MAPLAPMTQAGRNLHPISHLMAAEPDGNFLPARANRYLEDQPTPLAYGGHFTPVMRDGALVAAFWTVMQQPPRYGLQGHAMRCVTRGRKRR